VTFDDDGSAAASSLRVDIDQLVLHGFSPGDRHRIAEAITTALSSDLEGWKPKAAGRVQHIDAGSFDVAPGGGAVAVGRDVARSVREALS